MKLSSLDVILGVFPFDLNKLCRILKDDNELYDSYKFIFTECFIPSSVFIHLPKLYKKGFDFFVRYDSYKKYLFLRVYRK